MKIQPFLPAALACGLPLSARQEPSAEIRKEFRELSFYLRHYRSRRLRCPAVKR
jgi:hypothetical protein